MAGVCIVFPVEFDGSTPDSHVTNVFVGPIEEVDYTRKDMERVVAKLRQEFLGDYPNGMTLMIADTAMFGRENDTLVFLPGYHPFNYLRDYAVGLLNELGVEYDKTFEYQAHITAPADWPAGRIPSTVKVKPPVLWWGNDRPYKKSTKVKSDRVNETHHFSRHIKLKNGPVVTSVKNVLGKRTKFKAGSLRISWRNGSEPTHVIVYGKNKKDVNCRRRYRMDRAPQWIKDVL